MRSEKMLCQEKEREAEKKEKMLEFTLVSIPYAE